MNVWNGLGRITKDIELKTSNNNKCYVKFGIAVDSGYKDKPSNFINCIAFNKTAEFICKFMSKGERIGVTGAIQTGNYVNTEGQKVYTTDILVNSAYFADGKKVVNDSYEPAAEDDETELPF
jgi:single-strand DNA-binding protein